MILTSKMVDDSELLQDVYRFRYDIMHEELNLIEANEKRIDTDVYDRYSIHFVILDYQDNICAYTRFIINSPIGYPTENNMQFDLNIENRDKLAELSRIFIAKDSRGIQTTKKIMIEFKKIIYHYIKLHNIEYIYGALEPSFLKLLQLLKINYQAIGEGEEYYGFRYPCILTAEDLVRDNPYLLEL